MAPRKGHVNRFLSYLHQPSFFLLCWRLFISRRADGNSSDNSHSLEQRKTLDETRTIVVLQVLLDSVKNLQSVFFLSALF